MTGGPKAWEAILAGCAQAFTAPSYQMFCELISAWVLCPARRTLTAMIPLADPKGRRAHDSYHRFLRAGVWAMAKLWQMLAMAATCALCQRGAIVMDLDDTLFHKSGRKVEGAAIFRDAVRSKASSVVYALGLNLVVITLRVIPPWGGQPLGLPINMRLYRKGEGTTHIELATEMIAEIASWLPDRSFVVCCDGAYASLAGAPGARTQVVSRMRRDAALYEAAPPPTGRRGRPRKKGARLDCPQRMASTTRKGWVEATIDVRGKPVERLLLARKVLWYAVRPDALVQLVVARDPQGKQPDDFFFSTDTDASPASVASCYAGRWSIEVTFRDVKQHLGGEQPQSWKHKGPERACALSLWLYTAVWLWYIQTQGAKPSWPKRPWYPLKRTPSFIDARAALRRALWSSRFFATAHAPPLARKIRKVLIDVLARAA